ncbi:hypothetical protein ACFP1I_21285 [Dyadobacter subterraneus]|uniref:Gliding motility protein GldL n=1 Tax=Dyadobacter subterraneus TaxID=2773304 RepID=A0ABR9W8G8_9BACT|nr:hypothetical protein [Dyadobacter subterraneus]MBE9460701.1 hypothetical protein [Dyadobacter subterraneus]
MKFKSKIGILIAGTLLALAGINLIVDSTTTKNLGAVLTLTGVFTNIVVLLILIKNENMMSDL